MKFESTIKGIVPGKTIGGQGVQRYQRLSHSHALVFRCMLSRARHRRVDGTEGLVITTKEVQARVFMTLKRNLDIARQQGSAIEVVISEEKHTLMRNAEIDSLFQACAANIAQALMGERVG